MHAVTELLGTWRAEAGVLRSYGDERGASLVEHLAHRLEAALEASREEELTLDEASEVSGYSKRRLREMIAEGRVHNAGEKGRPRILRADLPRKPGRSAPNDGYDPTEDARRILMRRSS